MDPRSKCKAQFSTVLCIEDRLLVLSNSVEILWLEPLCFSYQFLLLLRNLILLSLLGRALIWACFFYSAAPQTFLTWKLLISRTCNLCQAEPDQSIKIITRGNRCRDSVILYVSFPSHNKTSSTSHFSCFFLPALLQAALRDFSLLIHTLHRPCITWKGAFCSPKEGNHRPSFPCRIPLSALKRSQRTRVEENPWDSHTERCEAALVDRQALEDAPDFGMSGQ